MKKQARFILSQAAAPRVMSRNWCTGRNRCGRREHIASTAIWGFIVLGELVETVTGKSLDRFCLERIYKPLGLRSTGFVDLTQLRTRRVEAVTELIAPTEQCPWRRKILCGEVHDDNAYAMGGVAGHAGLFASAQDVHRLLACLSRCLRGEDSFLPRSIVEQFFTKDESVENSISQWVGIRRRLAGRPAAVCFRRARWAIWASPELRSGGIWRKIAISYC